MPNFKMWRNLNRNVAFLDKGGKCDLCGGTATEYHEIIQRGKTEANPSARYYSYNKVLCACLCPSCHATADSREVGESLLKHNYELYGQEVINQYENISKYINYIGLEVPWKH